ncbi:MAG: GNAT family N-acetyltransferase [Clostridia bacterium]|nr:GNAT family N-acetyltransferase [Clostridia bacterium]
MIFELEDTTKAAPLFDGWEETLIYSCLQKVMGKVFVTDVDEPKSAVAFVGCFALLAGEPSEELVLGKPDGFVIMIPQNDAWSFLIEKSYPDAVKRTRYAIRKDTRFDREFLEKKAAGLPDGYELRDIDSEIYDMCMTDPVTASFVCVFENKEKYLEDGRGMVIMKDGKIVSGASSYTRYKEGIEIEIDTNEDERGKGLATIVCAALILRCLDEGLYPSWDAHNMISVHLAQKLGYEFSHEYTAYEVCSEKRTH